MLTKGPDIALVVAALDRARLLVELSVASGDGVLLVGPAGAGKTTLVNSVLDDLDPSSHVSRAAAPLIHVANLWCVEGT